MRSSNDGDMTGLGGPYKMLALCKKLFKIDIDYSRHQIWLEHEEAGAEGSAKVTSNCNSHRAWACAGGCNH